MTTQGSTTFGYNDNGAQTRKTVGGQNTTYAWDFENRLSTITFPDATSESFQYSTDGVRMSRTTGGVKTWYAYDFRDDRGFNDVLAEYSVSGSLVARFVHGPGADRPLAEIRGGTYFYSYDALGSATRLTTTSQTTNARYRYEAFGSQRDTLEGVVNPYRFTGRELDSQTGSYFYRARWYEPTTGRFLSKDPAGMTDGPNLYAYVLNNPVNRQDPSGKVIACVFGFFGFLYLLFDCLNTFGNPLWVVTAICCFNLYAIILTAIVSCVAFPPGCALFIFIALLVAIVALAFCWQVCRPMDLIVRLCFWWWCGDIARVRVW